MKGINSVLGYENAELVSIANNESAEIRDGV